MRTRPSEPTLERETVEALLSGRTLPAGVPAPYHRVAAALAAAAAPPHDDELTSPEGVVARLAAVARDGKGRRAGAHLRRSFRLSFRSKVVAVGMALCLVLTGSLAAAGALPDSAQRVAHNVLKKVGVHVPGPNPRAGNHPFERGKSGKPKLHLPGQGGKPSQNPHSQQSPTGGS